MNLQSAWCCRNPVDCDDDDDDDDDYYYYYYYYYYFCCCCFQYYDDIELFRYLADIIRFLSCH